MKRYPMLLVAAALVIVIVVMGRENEPAGEEIASPPASTRSRVRLPSSSTPFWESARAARSGDFRAPVAVDPAALGIPSQLPPVDHPEHVAALHAAGNLQDLQAALAAWFRADPSAARDWLASLESFEIVQPALSMIAGHIAQQGDSAHALEWAALLNSGAEKEQVFFDIYALAARSHHFTEAELRNAPLPPEQIEELLSGAAGD